jgi:hypothetical protein
MLTRSVAVYGKREASWSAPVLWRSGTAIEQKPRCAPNCDLLDK